MATPEMIAAVSAAVRGEDPPAPIVADPVDSPAADPVDPSAAAVEDLVGTDPTAAVDPVDSPAAADAGRVRGPDGKFLPKVADSAEPVAAVAAAPVAPIIPAAAPKVVDPVNDPIPDNVKAVTRERITTLVDTVKAKDTEIEAARGDLDLIMNPIREAGATVEQFQESMQLVRLINSPHQHEQMQALQQLQSAAAVLAERLGQVPAGADPLAGQADLLQAVQANQMPRQYAEEVARSRRLTAATQQHQQVTQQRTQQTQAQQQAVQAGQASVRAIEQTLEATDPQYKTKVAMLRADTAFLGQLRTLPPTQWGSAFAEKYRTIKVAASAAATPVGPSPLRAKTPAGTAAKPPGSMLDAVRGALSELRAG